MERGVPMTIWHFFSAIAFIAAIASALTVGKEHHAHFGVYTVCVVLGTGIGIVTGGASLFCARFGRERMRNEGGVAKMMMIVALVFLSIACIVVADQAGRACATATLRVLGVRWRAGGAPLKQQDEFGCRTLMVFKGAGFDFFPGT